MKAIFLALFLAASAHAMTLDVNVTNLVETLKMDQVQALRGALMDEDKTMALRNAMEQAFHPLTAITVRYYSVAGCRPQSSIGSVSTTTGTCFTPPAGTFANPSSVVCTGTGTWAYSRYAAAGCTTLVATTAGAGCTNVFGKFVLITGC